MSRWCGGGFLACAVILHKTYQQIYPEKRCKKIIWFASEFFLLCYCRPMLWQKVLDTHLISKTTQNSTSIIPWWVKVTEWLSRLRQVSFQESAKTIRVPSFQFSLYISLSFRKRKIERLFQRRLEKSFTMNYFTLEMQEKVHWSHSL